MNYLKMNELLKKVKYCCGKLMCNLQKKKRCFPSPYSLHLSPYWNVYFPIPIPPYVNIILKKLFKSKTEHISPGMHDDPTRGWFLLPTRNYKHQMDGLVGCIQLGRCNFMAAFNDLHSSLSCFWTFLLCSGREQGGRALRCVLACPPPPPSSLFLAGACEC